MATRERRLHLAHFSLDSDGDDSDETNTPTRVHANGHTCALVWCDEVDDGAELSPWQHARLPLTLRPKRYAHGRFETTFLS